MPHTREVRLGLVLYGGVSLAVYENGVARELYHGVRGDGVYGLLKHLIDSDIVVDIVSGTSAGGVNGVMLSYALANNRDFTLVGDLWRNQADIDQLLRKESDGQTQSVLDSDWYEKRLAECFERLRTSRPPAAPALSSVGELDLFVTGTDAHGAVSTVCDDQGHPIDVKNHRALFKLAYRAGRTGDNAKNNFETARSSSLARLCRLTSCFPVAFAPVEVGRGDTDLNEWRASRAPAVFLDGGILNNKPFTSTIDAIRRRTANRDVDRFLIYVEPDPERFEKPKPGQVPAPPPAARAAVLALVSIPGYQSIGADLAAVEAHNEHAERIEAVLKPIGLAEPVAPAGLAIAAVCPEQAAPSDTYLNCRLIQLRDQAVAGILNTPEGRTLMTDGDRRAARVLVESFNYWAGSASGALRDFDVYFRRRRVERLSGVLMQLHKRPGAQGGLPPADAEGAWNLLNHYFKLYEILEWAMKDSLDRADFGWRSLAGTADQLDGVFDEERREAILGPISAAQWSQVQGTLSAMLDTAGIEMPVLPDSAARARFYDALKARRGKPPLPAIEGNLLHALDRSFAEALGNLPADRAGNLLRGEYVRFLDLDRLVFPLRFGAQFESTEPIRVVRFSPLDAQRGLCRGAVADKVCGRALGNFGGFFKKSWRANDIMIGRMDAVCQLIEGLLTRERLANFGPPADLTAARIRGFFATLGDGQAQQLADELNFFLAHPAAYTRDRWDALLDALVGAAHGDILAEEWPRVFDCAIQQEYQWGQYRTNEAPPPQPYDPEHLAWTRARKRPDRVLVAVAGEAIRSRRLPEFQPGQIAGHPFSEEIPEPILTELGLLGAIRASRSLVGSLPKERQEGVTKNLFYRRLFSQLLPFAYWWAAIRRRNPDSVIVLNTIGITAGIAVFLVGFLLFLNPFGWHMSWKVWAVTMGAPAASFLIWILVFGWRGHRHSLRQ